MKKIKGYKERIGKKEIFAGLHTDSEGDYGIVIEIKEEMKNNIPAVSHTYDKETDVRTTTMFVSFPVFHFVNSVILTKYVEEDERETNL